MVRQANRRSWMPVVAAAVVAVALCAVPTGARDGEVRSTESVEAPPAGTRTVAPTVWFQGFLADVDTGDPLSGPHDVVARIFTAPVGGGLVWGPETHNGTMLTEGWFNIELGESMPLPGFDTPPYYLQLTIEGEILAPRQKLGSVPSAFHANDVYWPDGDWWISGGDIYRTTGNVGIGTATPFGRLEVVTGDQAGVVVSNAGLIGNLALEVSNTATGSAGGFFAQSGPSVFPVNPAAVFAYTEAGADGGFFHGGDGGKGVFAQSSEDGAALWSRALGTGYSGYFTGGDGVMVTTEAETGGWFGSDNLSSSTIVLYAEYSGPSGFGQDPVAVWGYSRPQDWFGIGGQFTGGWKGVVGEVYVTGSASYKGVEGVVDGGTGDNMGVGGYATGLGYNIGVYGYAANGGTNYAGYFSGDILVLGDIDAATVTIKRDHPLDPANQYLTQWAVESAEMTSVLNGNVVLDAGGEAAVEIPGWFEGTTRDHRYQLTCVGGFAPVYVVEQVARGVLRIAGGEPGMTISWQVTGVRNDPLAQSERAAVESRKPAGELGKYRDPAVYGMPRSAGLRYNEEDEARQRRLREAQDARRSRAVEEDSGTGWVPASVKR